MFFKSKPNVPDAEKARIEFHFQQIAECIGFDRFRLPVLSHEALMKWFDSDWSPLQILGVIGDHLSHDTTGLELKVVPGQGASCSGGGCGGSCEGPSGLLGKYDSNTRSIVLEADLESDPPLGLATLVDGVAHDLLYQNEFPDAILPEVVELAVVGTGLGMLRNKIALVGKSGSFWDSTQWGIAPRPFLDSQNLAYANAITTWARDEPSPDWGREVIAELKRPLQKSIKYLFKTNDSFFQPSRSKSLLGRSQDEWWALVDSESTSQQVIALRHLRAADSLSDRQETLLREKLGSANRAIVLHAITAAERMAADHRPIASESVVRELRLLADHRDDEVCAKAMCTLTRLDQLDETTVEVAANMLESPLRHVVFAGAYALASIETIPDPTLKLVDRVFFRALRNCDYEFVGMFATAYRHWLDDAETHVQDLLQDSPEFVPVALSALQQGPPETVSIG